MWNSLTWFLLECLQASQFHELQLNIHYFLAIVCEIFTHKSKGSINVWQFSETLEVCPLGYLGRNMVENSIALAKVANCYVWHYMMIASFLPLFLQVLVLSFLVLLASSKILSKHLSLFSFFLYLVMIHLQFFSVNDRFRLLSLLSSFGISWRFFCWLHNCRYRWVRVFAWISKCWGKNCRSFSRTMLYKNLKHLVFFNSFDKNA